MALRGITPKQKLALASYLYFWQQGKMEGLADVCMAVRNDDNLSEVMKQLAVVKCRFRLGQHCGCRRRK
nr:truncated hypothetical protein PS903_05943 [uncultured bacterium]